MVSAILKTQNSFNLLINADDNEQEPQLRDPSPIVETQKAWGDEGTARFPAKEISANDENKSASVSRNSVAAETPSINSSQFIASASQKLNNSSYSNPDWVNMEFTDIGKSIFLDYPLSKDRKDLKMSSVATAMSLNDLNLLSNLALSRGGLLTNELRSKVWPLFLGIDNISDTKLFFNHENAEAHKDEGQVQLDVNRSFSQYPKDRSSERLNELRQNLKLLIVKVLRKYPQLCYYQGYHDIAQLVLLVFNNNLDESFVFLERLTLLHLRDYMMPTIDSSIHHLNLILLVIYHKDYNFFKILNNLKPFYSLSSIITLFTHDVSNYEDICYVLDYLLSNNNSVVYNSIYLYSAILLLNKNQILNLIFENIYNKINCNNVDSISNSYMSESDTLAESMLSNVSASISENASSYDSEDQIVKESSYDVASVTESQYQKASPLSSSDFIGYDDNDIELINFDYLHNILSNLIADYSNKVCESEKNHRRAGNQINKEVSFFEVFTKSNELMKSCPMYGDIEEIKAEKTFGKDNYTLKIELSDYSVLKNTSTFIPNFAVGDLSKVIQDYIEETNGVPLVIEILNKQYEEVVIQQQKEKEEQMRQFEELMKKKRAKKLQSQKAALATTRNNNFFKKCYQVILYPLTSSNSKLVKVFKNHKLIKFGLIIGILSLFIKVYENNGYCFGGLSLEHVGRRFSDEFYSFGRSFHAGINSVVSQHSGSFSSLHSRLSLDNLVDTLSDFSDKVFS